jgi:hypothetical protein
MIMNDEYSAKKKKCKCYIDFNIESRKKLSIIDNKYSAVRLKGNMT